MIGAAGLDPVGGPLAISIGFWKIGITFGVEARSFIVLASIVIILAVSCFLAVGALLLRFGLASISSWSMTLASIAWVEVPLLEGAIDRTKDESVEAFGVVILLEG